MKLVPQDSPSYSIAQIVLLSSVCTVVVIAGLLFIVRSEIVSYILAQVPSEDSPKESTTVVLEQEPIVDMVERVNNSVVSVIVTKDVPVYEQYYQTFDQWGGLFSVPRIRENGTQENNVGGGTGFIVSFEGHIVTNNHVVADESARYSILLTDGTQYGVDVLARDEILDVAVLKINEPITSALTSVSFGDSDELKLDQTVVTIGNALATFQNSISVGVVSGISRSIVTSNQWGRSEQLDQLIQTDAAINPGNSGGPLFNLKGEVVGVNVAVSQGAENIGFAIPSVVVAHAVASVREYGEIIRPHLGVRYSMITPHVAKMNNLPSEYGALLVSNNDAEPAVLPGSPAEKAGLKAGDIVLSIDEIRLQTNDIASVLKTKAIGDVVTLEVLRGTEKLMIQVTVERSL